MEYLQYWSRYKRNIKRTITYVLNLIINGIPSIQYTNKNNKPTQVFVLNLIINGIPSIPDAIKKNVEKEYEF